MQSIRVRTDRRTQMVDITVEVQRVVTALGVRVGTCFLYVPHTTAAILINEHADPDVASDAEGALDRIVPMAGPYRHSEGKLRCACENHARRRQPVRFRGGREAGAGALAGNFLRGVRRAARTPRVREGAA